MSKQSSTPAGYSDRHVLFINTTLKRSPKLSHTEMLMKVHVAMGVLYALQYLGYAIPPQADAGWIGEAGPGPSYGDQRDDGSFLGFDNEFTQRNMTFMAWNLLHLARMLKDAGGIPAHGNQRTEWDAGHRFDHPNPEYR